MDAQERANWPAPRGRTWRSGRDDGVLIGRDRDEETLRKTRDE